MHRRRVTALPARPTLEGGLELPDWRIARSPDRIEWNTGLSLAPMAFHPERARADTKAYLDEFDRDDDVPRDQAESEGSGFCARPAFITWTSSLAALASYSTASASLTAVSASLIYCAIRRQPAAGSRSCFFRSSILNQRTGPNRVLACAPASPNERAQLRTPCRPRVQGA